MSVEPIKKLRPYWHVDAKWIAGLILVIILNVTLLLAGLVQLTAEQPAIEILTMSTALLNSPNGLDDEADIALLRLALAVSPDGTIQPVPGLQISISAQEIEGLTPREMRLRYFQKWAEPVYQDGIEGLAALADDPALKAEILEQGAWYNALTLKTHRTLQQAFVLSGAAGFFFLLLLVLFSYRFGRIASPGWVLLLGSLPGAILFTLAGMAVIPEDILAPGEGGMTSVLSYLGSSVLPLLANSIKEYYVLCAALGLGLILLAAVSSIVWGLIRGNR